MRYIWSASDDDGGTWRELTPLNGSKLSIGRARDLEAGQAFYRKVLEQGMVLGGEDFRWLDAKRASPALRCAEILIRCEALCGQRQEYWRGRFSPGSASWDLDSCKLEVKPEPVDRYTCLLDKSREKVNVLNTPTVNARSVILPVGMEISVGYDAPNPEDAGWDQVDTQSFTLPANSSACSGSSFTLPIYWRETIINECVNGAPVTPPGSGWINVSDEVNTPIGLYDCDTDGLQKWARIPTVAWPWPDDAITLGGWNSPSLGLPMTPPSGTCSEWIHVATFTCVGGHQIGYYLCPDDASSEFTCDNGRMLEDCINLLLERAGCDLQVRSDFFEWDAPGDALGYSPGINYVTGEQNALAQLLLLQKSDAIDPAASNPATIGELTFEEAMTMLAVAFRCLWDIDDKGFLRIEHRSYWRQQVGLDLNDHATAKEMLSWESLGAQAPRTERAVWMEAQGRDFVGKDIVYSGPCVGKDSKEWTPGRFTTDIAYIVADPDAISKDGFCILATTLQSGIYQAILDYGAITNGYISNAPLSWANLERDYWQHDRYRPSGMMNGADTDFEDFLPTIKQSEASVRMCCSLLDYDPSKRVAGALSRRLGVDAEVQSASHSLFTDRLTLVLIYPY